MDVIYEIQQIWNRIVRLEKTVFQNFNSEIPDNPVISQIDLLSEKVSTMEKNIKSVNNTIGELQSVEERNKSLEEENKDLKIENDKLKKQNKFFDSKISDQIKRIEILTDEKNKLAADSNKKDGLELKIKQLKDENAILKEANNKLVGDKNRLNDRVKELEFKLKTDKSALEEQVETLQTDQKNLYEQVSGLETDKEILHEQVSELETDKETLQKQVSELEIDKETLQKQVSGLETDKEALHEQISGLETDKEALHEQISGLEADKKTLHEQVSGLEADKEALHEQVSGLETDKEILHEQISGLETDKEALHEQISGLEADKEALKDNISKLKSDNKTLEKKMNQEVDALSNIIQEKSNAWAAAIEQYQKLILLMYQCDSLNPLVEGFGMEVSKKATDYKSVISFVGMLGNELTFAAYLYNFWDSEKSADGNRRALDINDYRFIDALNQYYEELYGLGYDVIYYPKSGDNRFNKELMKDIESSNRVFQRFSDIYVPAVMRDGSHVEKMMKVKGE